MGWRRLGATAAAMFFMTPVAARAQGVLTVMTYNNYGIADDDLAGARAHVDAIFRKAGIGVQWVDCWYKNAEVAGAAAHCEGPLKTNEVILRLQAANALPGRRHVSMGFALVNVSRGVPFLATVFADVVRTIARDARLDYRPLLGRAIAHELGHLLLDNNGHSGDGLMRAGWSNAELRADAQHDWSFGDGEIATIRSAAVMRNRPR